MFNIWVSPWVSVLSSDGTLWQCFLILAILVSDWASPMLALTEKMSYLCYSLSWETPNPAWRYQCMFCAECFFHSTYVQFGNIQVFVFNPQVVGVTALACGMIAVGSCNGDVTSTIVQTIMEKNEQELKDSYARWLPLGLGLNHLGKHLQPQASKLLTIITSTYCTKKCKTK